jgi:SAM-dependent methyltransferase
MERYCCPLCNCSSVTLESSTLSSDLVKLYRTIGVDVDHELSGVRQVDLCRCVQCDLKFFHPNIVGSAPFYERLSTVMDATYYQQTKSDYMCAARNLRDDDCVLDVGSGSGRFAAFVKGRYCGLDFNPGAIAEAKARGCLVLNESIEQHADSHPCAYTVVTAFQVLEHMAEPADFLRSCIKALAVGGRLIISVPSDDSFVGMARNDALNMPPHHATRWTDAALANLAERMPLRLIALEHERLSEAHYEPYLCRLIQVILRRVLGMRANACVDLSLSARLIARFSRFLALRALPDLRRRAVWPNGHTVTVIYTRTR